MSTGYVNFVGAVLKEQVLLISTGENRKQHVIAVRQDKPGCSSDLKGGRHVNYPLHM
jgi:hypothetical protein